MTNLSLEQMKALKKAILNGNINVSISTEEGEFSAQIDGMIKSQMQYWMLQSINEEIRRKQK